MGMLTFNQAFTTSTVDGPISSDTAVLRPILTVTDRFILPNQFFRIGSTMRITATGYVSIVTAIQSVLIFNLNMGVSGGVIFINFQNLNSVAAGIYKDEVPFRLDGIFTIRSVGKTSATTAYGIFKLHCEALVGSPLSTVGGSSCLVNPAIAPVSSQGFDNTIANMVYLESRFATAGQIMQVNQYVLEALN